MFLLQQPAYVESPHFAKEGAKYFASNVELGPNGVEKILDIGNMSSEEQELLKECLPQLAKNIAGAHISHSLLSDAEHI